VEWVSFQHGDMAVDGLHGYHSYEYEWRVTPRAGGKASVSCGKGLHVLRREADGSWKIVREIWNASPAKNR
jgi:ketosteroid isomerase-like protein